MAVTRISDVIEPSIFADYVIQRTPEKHAAFRAGIVQPDPVIASRVAGGGRTINMPFWNNLSAVRSEVLSDSGALTPNKIDADQDVAHILYRGVAFSTNELAEQVAGDDPMGAIVDQTTDMWNGDLQQTLFALLEGLVKGELSSSHVNDISIEDGDAATDSEKFSDDAFLDTVFQLGDRQTDFTAVMVHSVIMQAMLKADLIDFVQPSGEPAEIPMYRGRRVIVDDGVLTEDGATSGKKYYTFAFGNGAIGWGETAPPTPVETDRDSLKGEDYLIHRRQFIMHPRGVKWTGTPAGVSPTDAELATTGNWSKVYDDKLIKIGCLVTNG